MIVENKYGDGPHKNIRGNLSGVVIWPVEPAGFGGHPCDGRKRQGADAESRLPLVTWFWDV